MRAPIMLPASAVTRYEQLRADVLRGQARPEGLGAVVYHGFIEGLNRLCSAVPRPVASCPSTPQPRRHDRELVRLMANMMLQAHSEVTHVY